jgi:plasmid maintenance system antidote protein VapI
MHRENLLRTLRAQYPNRTELARLLDVHPSLIVHMYAGRRSLTIETMKRIRDLVPGFERRAQLALKEQYRELYDAPIGAPPADSQDSKQAAGVA